MKWLAMVAAGALVCAMTADLAAQGRGGGSRGGMSGGVRGGGGGARSVGGGRGGFSGGRSVGGGVRSAGRSVGGGVRSAGRSAISPGRSAGMRVPSGGSPTFRGSSGFRGGSRSAPSIGSRSPSLGSRGDVAPPRGAGVDTGMRGRSSIGRGTPSPRGSASFDRVPSRSTRGPTYAGKDWVPSRSRSPAAAPSTRARASSPSLDRGIRTAVRDSAPSLARPRGPDGSPGSTLRAPSRTTTGTRAAPRLERAYPRTTAPASRGAARAAGLNLRNDARPGTTGPGLPRPGGEGGRASPTGRGALREGGKTISPPESRPRLRRPGEASGSAGAFGGTTHGFGESRGNYYRDGFRGFGRGHHHHHHRHHGRHRHHFGLGLWGLAYAYGYPHPYFGFYGGWGLGFGFGYRGWYGGWWHSYPWYDCYAFRYGYGFGYYYDPVYYAYAPYPFVRYYAWYPYPYYATYLYYPGYITVYHRDYVPVGYVEMHDPYVEYVDEVRPAAALPEPFQEPLVTGDFPEALSADDLLARGLSWLQAGDSSRAAEAFRRVWATRPKDYYPPLQLSMALLGAGRYDLAGHALSHGLDRNPDYFKRDVHLADSFGGRERLDDQVNRLKRHLVENPRQGEARLLLGYVSLVSGDAFTAHGEFTRLKEAGWDSPHLDALLREAEARVMAERK